MEDHNYTLLAIKNEMNQTNFLDVQKIKQHTMFVSFDRSRGKLKDGRRYDGDIRNIFIILSNEF